MGLEYVEYVGGNTGMSSHKGEDCTPAVVNRTVNGANWRVIQVLEQAQGGGKHGAIDHHLTALGGDGSTRFDDAQRAVNQVLNGSVGNVGEVDPLRVVSQPDRNLLVIAPQSAMTRLGLI